MDIYEKSLDLHERLSGKLMTDLRASLDNAEDLSLMYSPGVAEPCRQIHKNPSLSYKYTWKKDTVAVISDGSAVLGLGNIGPLASLPVMEGKCCLFKRFAGLNAVPVILDTQDTEEIIQIVKSIALTYGGINLEDISSPRCIEIEKRLKEELDIPVFHDDQHGTAIVVLAGLINALKLVEKKPEDLKLVINGTGAAGSAIIKILLNYGVKEILAFNSKGILNINKSEDYAPHVKEIASLTNPNNEDVSLAEAVKDADVFIGVSVANVLTSDMVKTMAKDSIIFALANPDPEIDYDLAKEAGARVVATGRSDYPNQINNVLAFPGIFKGAMEVGASEITEEMKLSAALAIADLVDDLSEDQIIPRPFDPRISERVAQAVGKKAKEENVIRKDFSE